MAGSPLHDRLYRALLRVFPREFRGDFGEQMEADFRDQRVDAESQRATKGVIRLWMRTAFDLVRRAPAEHLDGLRRDGGYALRLLRRNPGFAAAVILTLAIGVGSTTAVFTLADPMLFRPLPYPDSDRLVEVYGRANGHTRNLHVPDFLRAEAVHRGFTAIACHGVSRYVAPRRMSSPAEPCVKAEPCRPPVFVGALRACVFSDGVARRPPDMEG